MRNFITMEDVQQAESVNELKAISTRLYNDRELALRALRILDGIYVNTMNKLEGDEEGTMGKNIEPWLALAESDDPKMINVIENVILGHGLVVRSEN
jgi:hypothetical protein